MDQLKNFARSTVAVAPSPASTGLSLTVATGHGTRFPTPPFNATVYPAASAPSPANATIVRCTAIVGDVLTIVRNAEESAVRSILVGDRILAGPTKKTFDDLRAVLTADPSAPDDDTWWIVRDGNPEEISVRARVDGITYTIAAVVTST